MVVIHIDSMEDTARLKSIYDGLDNVTLLYNKTREEIDNVLSTNNDKIVMCLGHGNSSGLFGVDWKGYAIDEFNAKKYLKDRILIGIWCNASDFADAYGMHGYFTSMFISNYAEASFYGFVDNEVDDIYNEIDVFCEQIKGFIKNNVKMNEWVGLLQENCHKEKDFVRFNYSAMAYFD